MSRRGWNANEADDWHTEHGDVMPWEIHDEDNGTLEEVRADEKRDQQEHWRRKGEKRNWDTFVSDMVSIVKLRHPNVTFSMNDEGLYDTGLIDLSSLYAVPEGQGHGTHFMWLLMAMADYRGVDIEVYAGITEDGSDPVRLIEFYQRFQFVLQNPDTWRDDGTGEHRPYLIRRHR